MLVQLWSCSLSADDHKERQKAAGESVVLL